MRKQEFEECLSESLRPRLAVLGFREDSTLVFLKDQADVGQILAFGGRLDNGQFRFSCNVGLRFASLERILRPDRSDRSLPTILMPLHLLREGRHFIEWSLNERSIPSEVAEEIVDELSHHALPFLDRHTELEVVQRRLESPDPKSWFILTSEQRVCLLAAIAEAAGGHDVAVKIIDGALAERIGELPKKRRKLQKLRSQLVTQGQRAD